LSNNAATLHKHLSFDGVDDKVTFGANPEVGALDFSIVYWLKFEETSIPSKVIGYKDFTPNIPYIMLRTASNGRLFMDLHDGFARKEIFTDGIATRESNVLVVFTADVSGNGVLYDTENGYGTPVDITSLASLTNMVEWIIGNNLASRIYLFYVYDRVLTNAEIAQLEENPYNPPVNGLVHKTGDEITGSTWSADVGTDGTISGATTIEGNKPTTVNEVAT